MTRAKFVERDENGAAVTHAETAASLTAHHVHEVQWRTDTRSKGGRGGKGGGSGEERRGETMWGGTRGETEGEE